MDAQLPLPADPTRYVAWKLIMKNSAIERYFLSYAERLRVDFERSRQSHSDSSVKGSNNEQIAADFLSCHFPSNYVVTNVEILDANDNSCDEIDVCVCNPDQPFSESPGQLLLAEGVDFVLQVKAILTTAEIGRIRKNAGRLKTLIRSKGNRDTVFGKVADAPFYWDRIPYIVLAFTSELKLETARTTFMTEFADVAPELQPDAIFILDRGLIHNFRDSKGYCWHQNGKPLTGWIYGESGDRTLLEMMRFLFSVVARISRNQNPICHYFTTDLSFPVHGNDTPP